MPSSPPLVSVVIPAYRGLAYLPKSIGSVQAQTMPHWQCLVVDDASPDDTAAWVEAMSRQDPRIRLIRQPKNAGGAAARRAGGDAAQGQWIAMLDQDDWWEPNKLEVQLAAIRQMPQAVWSFHPMWHVRDGQIIQKFGSYPPEADFLRQLLVQCLVLHSSVLIRRQAYGHVGGHDPAMNITDDWDLFIRLTQRYGNHGVAFVDQVLGSYRLHANNTSNNLKAMQQAEWRCLRAAWKRQGFWRRHPITSLKMLDGQMDRQWQHAIKSHNPASARFWAMAALLLAPYRSHRWKRLLA